MINVTRGGTNVLRKNSHISLWYLFVKLIPVVSQSKAWVCSHQFAGIAGSNRNGGMNVCLLWVWCVVR